MISALTWVPKGVAKAVPTIAEPSPDELAAMRAQLEAEADDADDAEEDSEPSSSGDGGDAAMDDSDGEEGGQSASEAVARARAVASSMASSRGAGGGGGAATGELEAALRELQMDRYDDSGDDEAQIINRVLGTSGKARLEYADGEADPYLNLGDDDSEIEDYTLKPSDLIILSAKTEDDVSNLEVWVYEEADADGAANLYVHHEVLLPAFPLCLAWFDCDPKGDTARRNLVAVGTLEPSIEIWDLDVVDSVEPTATLGGIDRSGASGADEGAAAKGKKGKKVRQACSGTADSCTVPPGVAPLVWRGQLPVCALGRCFSAACAAKLCPGCMARNAACPAAPRAALLRTEKAQDQAAAWQPRGQRAGAVVEPRVPQRLGLRQQRQNRQGAGSQHQRPRTGL
jgi:periodic tryptophan protein 1